MVLRFKHPQHVIDEHFPKLLSSDHEITSRYTRKYNCAAWVVGHSDKPWWPRFCDQLYDKDYRWIKGAPEEDTVEAFTKGFNILGYAICQSSDLEHGFEKVAIYAKNRRPKHVALQLPDGKWTSKLGDDVDISHEIWALDGPLYGRVEVVMRRRRT